MRCKFDSDLVKHWLTYDRSNCNFELLSGVRKHDPLLSAPSFGFTRPLSDSLFESSGLPVVCPWTVQNQGHGTRKPRKAGVSAWYSNNGFGHVNRLRSPRLLRSCVLKAHVRLGFVRSGTAVGSALLCTLLD